MSNQKPAKPEYRMPGGGKLPPGAPQIDDDDEDDGPVNHPDNGGEDDEDDDGLVSASDLLDPDSDNVDLKDPELTAEVVGIPVTWQDRREGEWREIVLVSCAPDGPMVSQRETQCAMLLGRPWEQATPFARQRALALARLITQVKRPPKGKQLNAFKEFVSECEADAALLFDTNERLVEHDNTFRPANPGPGLPTKTRPRFVVGPLTSVSP